MGTTLTHNVYLPDEGERNCYSGLAQNWQILDDAVGAIAGKANASHTHGNITNDGAIGSTAGLPIITGTDGVLTTGSFGNTAGTFCEGNDSRLSDARTPVAHTHVTADVTDLLSGDHTWTGDNTYSKPVVVERNTDTGNFLALKNTVAELGSTPASATPVTIAYRDKNDNNLGYMGVYYDTDGSNTFRLFVRNKYTSGAPNTSGTVDYTTFQLKLNADKSKEGIIKASFRPYDNNTYDLGSSSYQWNNLYAKNYYYNGTAWGLDKANTWTGVNTFSSASNCVCGFKFGTSGSYSDIRYYDSNDSQYAGIRSKVNELVLALKYSSASSWYSGANVTLKNNGTAQIIAYDGTETWAVNFTSTGVYPTTSNALELGTSTKKWKTLNGVNPGALSLPSKYYVEIGTDGWDLTGNTYNRVYINNANPTFPGILFIRVNSTDPVTILVRLFSTSGSEISYAGNRLSTTSNNTVITVPCPPSTNIYIQITTSSAITACRYYTLLGDPEFDSRSGS